ncbi:hypothetical protein HYU22_01395 [Candidatus Woesearchaeota archaeon]|nr:hypothetical protein [Candidatus Woesearchaeota archaeon]
MQQRGQAAGAAILLAIILGVLIMFIVLIPPQERAELLGEKTTSTSNASSIQSATAEETLLTASPGRIDYLGQQDIEHPIPVINLYTRTESKIIAEKNIAYLHRGVFSEEKSSLSFVLNDLPNTDNVLLAFSTDTFEGRLIITLNGEEIFNGDKVDGPITLPRNSLEKDNELIFRASSPGLAFWAANDISLEDIKVVADITSLDAQSSRSIFLISETEQNNVEKVTLKFQADCNFEQVGPLHIGVNGNEIYGAVPDCDLALIPIEFSPALVHAGENDLTFRTERGSYYISHILVKSQLKELDFPTYYFELSHEQYREVQNGRKRVRLEFNFVDVASSKYGEFVFNGHVRDFDTRESSLVVDLSRDVVDGNNALKIKPRKTIEIRELKVSLVK